MSIRLEPLGRKHRELLSRFENRHRSLEEYLKHYASQHKDKALSRTWVAVDEHAGTPPRIAGYFTIAATSVSSESLATLPGLSRLPSFPIPGILLARLAVDTNAQGQGLGRYLLEGALGQALQAEEDVGVRLFVTDAIDKEAVSFYKHFGFHVVSDSGDYPQKMVLDLLPILKKKRVETSS
jgi:ribosomal protein S18 acetylase RimI-like enzyme